MATSATPPSLDVVAQKLKSLGVWTDILPQVNPSQLKGVLEIRYPKVAVFAGEEPHRDQVQEEPKIFLHGGQLKPDAKYTLIMSDPDLMKTNDPIDKEVRHWVQSDLTLSSSGEVNTASKAHTSFLPSAPMPMTGQHRYIFILAEESKPLGLGERGGEADFKERLRFVAQDFITENGLSVVGVAAMKVAPTAQAGIDDLKLMGESAKHAVTG